MKLTKFFQAMIFTTMMALIYIHLQMKIFDLAYQGKSREQRIQELSDENRTSTYHILSLQSASSLGHQLLDEKSVLQFANSDQISTLATLPAATTDQRLAFNIKDKAVVNPLTGILSFMNSHTAEAQVLQRK